MDDEAHRYRKHRFLYKKECRHCSMDAFAKRFLFLVVAVCLQPHVDGVAGSPYRSYRLPVLRLRGAGKQAFKTALVGRKTHINSSLRLEEMAKFPNDAAVVKRGCMELWNICVNADKQYRIGKNKHGCKALVCALQIHWKNSEVMLEALRLACNMAFAQPNLPMGFNGWAHLFNQDEIGRMGGVRYIVNAMKKHVAYWDIQDSGTRALANLAYNHTLNAQRVVRWEGIQAVLEGMRIHRERMRVQEAGCLFLWSCLVTITNETHITYGYDYMGAPAGGGVDIDLRIAGKIAELGGVEDIVTALRLYGTNTTEEEEGINVGEQACAALWYLSLVPGKLRDTVKASDCIALAKATIRAQKDVPCGRTWAARLLELLTDTDCSKYMMPLQVPGPSVAQDRIQEIRTDKRVCQPGCGCDEAFGPNLDLKEEDDDGMDLGFLGEEDDIGARKKPDLYDKMEADKKQLKRKKRHNDRLVFKRGDNADSEKEDTAFEEAADTVSGDDDELGGIGLDRTELGRQRKKYKNTVLKFKKDVEKRKKLRRAWELQRHHEKSKTVLELAQEREDRGWADESDDVTLNPIPRV